MSTFKKCKVVMLSTNEKATIILNLKDNKISLGNEIPNEFVRFNEEAKHLYILSDEEIKIGDWALSTLDGGKTKVPYKCTERGGVQNGYCKIIATTDSSLGIELLEPHTDKYGDMRYNKFSNPFPTPSESFIEKFISEYNKGNMIGEVMVEFEEGIVSNVVIISPKVNPKDNTITIRKAKKSWNREEVIEICKKWSSSGEGLSAWAEANL